MAAVEQITLALPGIFEQCAEERPPHLSGDKEKARELWKRKKRLRDAIGSVAEFCYINAPEIRNTRLKKEMKSIACYWISNEKEPNSQLLKKMGILKTKGKRAGTRKAGGKSGALKRSMGLKADIKRLHASGEMSAADINLIKTIFSGI